MLRRRAVIIATLAGLVVAALALAWHRKAPAPPPRTLTIAVPKQLSSGAVFVARDHGDFADRSLAVDVRQYMLGKQALQAVIDDQAELALVADVPFMLASSRGAPIAAIAIVFASREAMALVGRRDRGIGGLADLAGKTVGTIKGTTSEYFLDMLIGTGRQRGAAPVIVQLQPGQLDGALHAGTVDAVTAWNPLLANIEREQGNNAVVMRISDLFVFRFLLVGKRSFIDANPDRVRSTLQALMLAVAYIQQQPAQAQALIARAVGLQPAQLQASFRAEDFAISLDQSLLLSLEDQARWAVRKGLLAAGTTPNYLNAIDLRPLAATAPAAVTIID